MSNSRPNRNGRGLFAGILLGGILGLLLGGYFGNRLWPAIIGAAVLGVAMYRVNPGGK